MGLDIGGGVGLGILPGLTGGLPGRLGGGVGGDGGTGCGLWRGVGTGAGRSIPGIGRVDGRSPTLQALWGCPGLLRARLAILPGYLARDGAYR